MLKQKIVRRIVKIIAFVLILGLLYQCGEKLLYYKSVTTVANLEFKELDRDKVDVLALGSSFCYTSFNTEVLWNDYGIASYAITSSWQPIAATYYCLRQALEYQHPQTVVIETGRLDTSVYYNDMDKGLSSTIGWMPYNKLRQEAVEYTNDDSFSGQRTNLLNNYFIYHNRWSSLKSEDFKYVDGGKGLPKTKGFEPWFRDDRDPASGPIEMTDSTKEVTINERCIQYLDKIVELCRNNGCDLVFYNSVGSSEIANFIRSHTGCPVLDFMSSSYDVGMTEWDIYASHAEYSGSIKESKYLGQYLIDNGYATDRRTDPEYSKIWDEDSHYFEKLEPVERLARIKDPEEYLQNAIALSDTVVIVTCDGNGSGDQSRRFLDIYIGGALVKTIDSDIIEYDDDLVLPNGRKLPVHICNQESDAGRVDVTIDYQHYNVVPEVTNYYVWSISGDQVADRKYYDNLTGQLIIAY